MAWENCSAPHYLLAMNYSRIASCPKLGPTEDGLLSEKKRCLDCLLLCQLPQGDISDAALRNHVSQYGEIQDSVVGSVGWVGFRLSQGTDIHAMRGTWF